MREDVRKYLIEVARKQGMCTYSDVNNACNLGLTWDGDHGSGEIGRILGEVAKFEHDKGRPVLSAVVVGKNTGEQGKGFYKICEEMGLGNAKKLQENFFAIDEMKRCQEFWSNDENYAKYY